MVQRIFICSILLLLALPGSAQTSVNEPAVETPTAISSTEPISLIPPKSANDANDKFADFPTAPEFQFNSTDLWTRIREGFKLEALDSPLVATHEQWYSSRPDYIQRFVERGRPGLHRSLWLPYLAMRRRVERLVRKSLSGPWLRAGPR